MEASFYLGPIMVTTVYFIFWYYLLFGLQKGTKTKLRREYKERGKVFDRYFGNNEEMLAADRAVINTQEQMIPFLVSLWLQAVFVSSIMATLLGAVYVVLRMLYPVLLGKEISRISNKRVYIVTIPSYLIVFYLLASTVWTAFK